MSDKLPGEGEVRRKTERRMWQECSICEAPATKKITYLLEGARSNPASSAYRHDDCSWCEDEHQFSCDEHEREVTRNPPPGYSWCSTFTANAGFAHMFLYWQEIKEGEA